MSFKIFSLQLRGKINSVTAVEKQREQLEMDYIEFKKTEKSDELKSFSELEKQVHSEAFKTKKKEIEGLAFKGSKEEKLLKECKKLERAKEMRKYFRVEDSQDMGRFEKERESEKISSYQELLDYVKNGQFEKEKKEIKSRVFKGSEEEKQSKEFKRIGKSTAFRAYKELKESGKVEQHEKCGESEKLKRYMQLKANSDKLGKEEKQELNSLKKDAEIRAYYKFERSKKLKFYREINGSRKLTRYNELKDIVESEAFKEKVVCLKDNKKFEKTEACKKYNAFKQLAADNDVKFVLKYRKSSLYRNYLEVRDSGELKRFRELKEIIDSDEYKKQKAWLEDKKRWEKTEAFKVSRQYREAKENPEIIKYLKYKDSDDFDCFKYWEIAFADDFAGTLLDTEKWSTLCPASGELKKNYAMLGDPGIFTEGKNLKIDNKLSIQVKKEKATGVVWKMQAGFVPAEFDYTSGVVSSNRLFKIEDGIVEAKIKFNPVKQVLCSFFLEGQKTALRMNILEMGKRNRIGTSALNAKGKIDSEGLDISNLKKGDYIFTLEKQGAVFTWKINGTEVLKQENRNFDSPMHLVASNLVVDEIPGGKIPVNFEIEWIKYYCRK